MEIKKTSKASLENKKDVKHVIETLDDIYNYEDDFFKTIDMYEHKD